MNCDISDVSLAGSAVGTIPSDVLDGVLDGVWAPGGVAYLEKQPQRQRQAGRHRAHVSAGRTPGNGTGRGRHGLLYHSSVFMPLLGGK